MEMIELVTLAIEVNTSPKVDPRKVVEKLLVGLPTDDPAVNGLGKVIYDELRDISEI